MRILREVEDRTKTGLILDCGCAQGNLGLLLGERGYRVVALDLQFQFLTYMMSKYEAGWIRPIHSSIDAPPFRASSFDVVLLCEVIEHVAEPVEILRRLLPLLRTGGILLVTTPNGDFVRSRVPTFDDIQDRAALRNRQFQPDGDGHLFLFTRKQLERCLEEAGYSVRSHYFYNTPFLTGSLGLRRVHKLLPVMILRAVDHALLSTPCARHIAEGHMVVAMRGS
jgi:2-polyprenyl-3-methyl-5-hydroxy-6-metoxy-1,4-benzoquinol methylase